jgi:protein-disulfide isomerase
MKNQFKCMLSVKARIAILIGVLIIAILSVIGYVNADKLLASTKGQEKANSDTKADQGNTISDDSNSESKLYDLISEEDFQAEVDKAIEKYIAKQQEAQQKTQEQAQKDAEEKAKNVPPLQSDDHFYGDRNAKIIVFEYSDMECPFCKKFHTDAKEFIDENKGEVALVFRHFPLTNIHPYAQKLAEGGICVAKVNGNEAFWEYADEVFESDGIQSEDQISEIAVRIGVQKDLFETCMKDENIAKKVQQSLKDGAASGITGTPGNIFYNTETKATQVVSGALPKEALEQVLTSMQK